MNKLDKLVISAKIKAGMLKDSLTSKKMGDSQIVVALILIVVAIGLALLFKDQVADIIKKISTTVSTNADDLAKKAAGTTGN